MQTRGVDPAALNRAAYDRIAEAYAARTRASAAAFFGPMRDRFVGALPARATVLDVGCGPGQLLTYFADAGLRPIGVDPSSQMLQLAQATGCPVVGGDMTALPFANGSLDAVWCQASLLHVPEDLTGAVISDIARVLRNGGRLGLITAVSDGPGQTGGMEEVDYAPGVHRWFIYRDTRALLTAVTDAGFTVLATERRDARRPWLALSAILRG